MEHEKLFEGEYRFMQVIWENAPVNSGRLVELCDKAFGWKKSTTYTMIKKMTEAVKKALSIDPNMTPEMIEELTPGIIKQFEILSNYGKQ